MKKLILSILTTIYLVIWTNYAFWAQYLPAAYWDHNVYVANLNSAVSSYLAANNNQIWNIETIRWIVYNSIASQWWWGWFVALPQSTWQRIARVENWTLIVWCWNMDLISFAVSPSSVTSGSYTTSWTCSSYLSNWVENWWNCNLSWNWTSAWTNKCAQTNTWSPVYSGCWTNTYSYTTTCYWTDCTDSAPIYSCNTSSCPWNVPRPANVTDYISISSNITSPTSSCSNVFANNSSTCDIRIWINWSTHQNKPIVWLSWLIVKNIQDKSNVASNRIDLWYNSINNNALNFTWVSNTSISWAWTSYTINISWIKSRSPFESNTWKVSFDLQWTSSYTTLTINNINYSFKKPFTWFLKSSLDWYNWDDLPVIWTVMNYKLKLEEKSSLLISGLTNYKFIDFTSKVEPGWTDSSKLNVQDVSVDSLSLWDKNWALFSARVNTSSWLFDTLPLAWLQVNTPYLTYTIDGHTVKYKLSNNVAPNDVSPIEITGSEFLWVKVVWTLQWSWKQTITWQNENFSDLSRSSVSADIRKNAYIITKGMNSWDVLNWVKYVEWDITISWDQNYETLVVKNGNVIISWDLNTSWNKFWIIVLKDNYNVSTDYQNNWNIYVNNWVKYIRWALYADGWLISSNWGVPYTTDSSQRTSWLQNQLIMKWILFTRNTIWWAILSWWYYLLPGWDKTSDFDNAMIYDLNYIRRWNNGCDKWGTSWCNDSWEYEDPFVIIYDSSIQLNPPKWFSN